MRLALALALAAIAGAAVSAAVIFAATQTAQDEYDDQLDRRNHAATRASERDTTADPSHAENRATRTAAATALTAIRRQYEAAVEREAIALGRVAHARRAFLAAVQTANTKTTSAIVDRAEDDAPAAAAVRRAAARLAYEAGELEVARYRIDFHHDALTDRDWIIVHAATLDHDLEEAYRHATSRVEGRAHRIEREAQRLQSQTARLSR